MVVTAPTLMFIKLTFFLLYLHIFYQNAKLKLCIYAGAFLSTLFYVSVTTTQFILATPRHGMTFRENVFSPHFEKALDLIIPVAAVGVGLDLYILILPVAGVMQLHMPPRRKIGVCLIFMTGILFVIIPRLESCFLELTIRTGPVSRLY